MADSSFFKNTGTSSQIQSSIGTSSVTATNAAAAASTSATAAATSATSAATSATAASTSAAASSASSSSASTSASTSSTASSNAQDWAVKTTGLVDSTDYASKAWAIGGAGVSGSNGASKEWATHLGSTVDGSDYSAKHYAQEAATDASQVATDAAQVASDRIQTGQDATNTAASQVAAAASAAAAAATLSSFDDRYYGAHASDSAAQTYITGEGLTVDTGDLYFNNTDDLMKVYDGAAWIAASSAGSASLINFNYTATASQTTFSGADDNSRTLSYTVDNLIVTRNGVVLEDGTDYTATSGTSIVLAVAATAGDEINVVAFESFTTADMVSATNGGTFQNNVTVNGIMTATAFSGDGSALTNLPAAGISDVVQDTTPQLGGNLDTNGNDINFGNSNKAVFGNSSDLQVYHDGNHSYVTDQGNGNLRLRGSNFVQVLDASGNDMIQAEAGGAVDIYHNGSSKLATTASGCDITGGLTTTGTVSTTARDGAIVDYSGSTSRFIAGRAGGNYGQWEAYVAGASGVTKRYQIDYDSTTRWYAADGTTERLRIDAAGNVTIQPAGTQTRSFGETVALKKDQSAPTRLSVRNDTNGSNSAAGVTVSAAGNSWAIECGSAAKNGNALTFALDATAATPSVKMAITSSGTVGIGTSSPSAKLSLQGNSGNSAISFHGTGSNAVSYMGSTAAGNYIVGAAANETFIRSDGVGIAFSANTGSSVQMRILSTGDIAFGNTVANTVSGYSNQPGGGYVASDSHFEFATTSNRAAVEIGKNNANEGQLVVFRKQGTALGTVGVSGGRVFFADQAQNTGISFYQSSLIPTNINGLAVDNVYDCGHPSYRWNEIRAANAAIQTSDANEKQQIAALTNAEMTAAKAISALFKTFKWNSAVEAKGDAARTHAGVIAQDVQAAMTAAGLDAGDYAFFISDTWWETQTEVPAVEADEENGVEAQEAYTRTDTYDTAEEAPEGATERTRMGIRYPELLAFVGAATEQRLANIETRISALEVN